MGWIEIGANGTGTRDVDATVMTTGTGADGITGRWRSFALSQHDSIERKARGAAWLRCSVAATINRDIGRATACLTQSPVRTPLFSFNIAAEVLLAGASERMMVMLMLRKKGLEREIRAANCTCTRTLQHFGVVADHSMGRFHRKLLVNISKMSATSKCIKNLRNSVRCITPEF